MTIVSIRTGRGLRPTRARAVPRLGAAVALGFLALVVFAALIGGLLSQDPGRQDLLAAATGPSGAHLLGTDQLGRDILARIIAGSHTVLLGPTLVAVVTLLVATPLGLLAGFRGGRVETLIMRTVDAIYALPALLVVIVVVGILGGGYLLAVAALVVLTVPADVRVVRAAVLGQRGLPYVEAARTLGLPPRRIMWVHVLPNVLPTIVANLLLDFVGGLVALSALSFLGLGLPAGSPDWGRMLSENRGLLDSNAWAALAPALLIVLTAVAVTVLGDASYERLSRGKADHD